MANTYELIASNTLTSSAASVTFSAIPNTYTDLIAKWSAQGTGSSIYLRLNSDTATNYSYTIIRGDGSAADSLRGTSTTNIWMGAQPTSSDWSSGELYIPSYTSTANKPTSSIVAREGNSAYIGNQMMATAGLYRNSSAITSVQFTLLGGGDFISGSSFFLYGIKNS